MRCVIAGSGEAREVDERLREEHRISERGGEVGGPPPKARAGKDEPGRVRDPMPAPELRLRSPAGPARPKSRRAGRPSAGSGRGCRETAGRLPRRKRNVRTKISMRRSPGRQRKSPGAAPEAGFRRAARTGSLRPAPRPNPDPGGGRGRFVPKRNLRYDGLRSVVPGPRHGAGRPGFPEHRTGRVDGGPGPAGRSRNRT